MEDGGRVLVTKLALHLTLSNAMPTLAKLNTLVVAEARRPCGGELGVVLCFQPSITQHAHSSGNQGVPG
eukprot:7380985-Prymnesium_polylepis.1